MPEYCVNIANAGKNTHVVVLIDWDASKRSLIKSQHITTDGSQFNDFVLDARPGLSTMTFVRNANSAGICQFFKESRTESKQNIFQFPYHLT